LEQESPFTALMFRHTCEMIVIFCEINSNINRYHTHTHTPCVERMRCVCRSSARYCFHTCCVCSAQLIYGCTTITTFILYFYFKSIFLAYIHCVALLRYCVHAPLLER